MCRWPDGQNPWSSLDLNFVAQARNLKQRLGETDPSRITDFDKLRSNQGNPCRRAHIVFTLATSAQPPVLANACHQPHEERASAGWHCFVVRYDILPANKSIGDL